MPEMLLDVTIQPVMFVLLFAFVFGGSISVPGESYREFLLPGIMVQTMTFASFVVAMGLTNDLEKGIVDRFRSLPISRASILVGRSISSLIHSSIGIVVMALTGLAIGWGMHNGFADAVLAYLLVAAVRLLDDLGRHLGRVVAALGRGGAGLHVHDHVPADLRRQHVRADREHADLAAHDRRVESGLGRHRRLPRAVGQRR